jgi:hypothetical protein
MDDNNGDWTSLVSGANAAQSGRPVGWDLVDHDVAVIDTATHGVTYVRHLMNICMALAVNPATAKSRSSARTRPTKCASSRTCSNGRFLRVSWRGLGRERRRHVHPST